MSKPRNSCQWCPRGRHFGAAFCARCQKPVCAKHVRFDATTREWLCPEHFQPGDLATFRKAKAAKPERPVYVPWWEREAA